MNFVVIGYYDRSNLGDESYKITFVKYFKNFCLKFISIDDCKSKSRSFFDDFDGIIVGGGDLFNDYFYNIYDHILEHFKKIKIAVSTGIPFSPCFKYLKHFDHIFIRNYEDLRSVQKIVGSTRVHFMPDLAFTLPIPNNEQVSINTQLSNCRKKCGIFLISNLIKFPFVVSNLEKLFTNISKDYDLIFYRFNYSNSHDDDKLINNLIGLNLITKHHLSICINNHQYSVNKMLESISTLDFAVCLRFHSHIFCMLNNIPFISISSTKKTKSLMNYAKLTNYQYCIQLNGYGTPIGCNINDMINIYNYSQQNLPIMKTNIKQFVNKCQFLLDHNQIEQIILQHDESIPLHVIRFINQYPNDKENASRIMTKKTIGCPDSVFNWGIIEKMKNVLEQDYTTIYDSINYLLDVSNDNKIETHKHTSELPIYIDISEYQTYKNVHRGGWYVLIESLSKIISNNGVYCDMYLDRTFHWCHNYFTYIGLIPYTMPWCGFIHHTKDTSQSKYNIIEMFSNKTFMQSLNTCTALFTLSPLLATDVIKLLKDNNIEIPVFTFVHPIVEPSINFSIQHYKLNKSKKLIQIGSWLRNYFTIHTINTPLGIEKYVLIGKNMSECQPPNDFKISPFSEYCEYATSDNCDCTKYHLRPCDPEPSCVPKWVKHLLEWLKCHKPNVVYVYNGNTLYLNDQNTISELESMINSVHYLHNYDNMSYDILLSNNIIFLHLIDVAACNVVIEAIIRNTPIMINKIPELQYLLGDNYPLYYNDSNLLNNTIDDILTESNILKAHKYLTTLDKKKYTIGYFMNQFKNTTKKLNF